MLVLYLTLLISIHALRGEGDQAPTAKIAIPIRFQSTPSVGRATGWERNGLGWLTISIHALRGEGDPYSQVLKKAIDISIHALRGEGDVIAESVSDLIGAFQSTPSVGRATRSYHLTHQKRAISIHALRGEGDVAVRDMYDGGELFQSTPSVGRATRTPSRHPQTKRHFNPRPPWGGRLYQRIKQAFSGKISIHALRGEGDNQRL